MFLISYNNQTEIIKSVVLNLSSIPKLSPAVANNSLQSQREVECQDYGGANQPEQLYVNLSTFWYLFLALITTAGLLISSVSNMIIIYLFTSTPSLRRNASNIISINLSISDMLYCVQWPSVIYCCLTQSTWILEYDLVCKSLGFITVSTALVSILTVVTMSVERAIVVKYSIHAKNHLTIRYAWCIIILIWFICICSCIPPLFGKFNRYTLDPSKTSCTLDYLSTHSDHKLYILILTIGYYFVPMIAITISYGIIIATFNKSSLSLKEVSACNDDLDNNNMTSSSTIYSKSDLNFFPPIQTEAAILPNSFSMRAKKLRDSITLKTLYRIKRIEPANENIIEKFSGKPLSIGYHYKDNLKRRLSFSNNNNNDNVVDYGCGVRRTSVSCLNNVSSTTTTTTIENNSVAVVPKTNKDILQQELLSKKEKFPTRRPQRTIKRTSTSICLLTNNDNNSCVDHKHTARGHWAKRNDSFKLSPAAGVSSSLHHKIYIQEAKTGHGEKKLSGESRASIKSLAPKFCRTLSNLNDNNENDDQKNLHSDSKANRPNQSISIISNSSERYEIKRFTMFNRGSASVNNSNNSTYCLTEFERSNRARSVLQFRLAKMSFYLILLWLISWSPIAWLAMINSILKCRRASATAVFIGSLMTKLNYFNSFLYTLSQPKLKNKFILIIKRLCCINKS